MQLWTAFLLGIVGSLHCAAMCGPLALGLPAAGGSRTSVFVGRTTYNIGRILTYCSLGAVLGFIGQVFVLAGMQRWLCLALGTAILAGFFAPAFFNGTALVTRRVAWIKSRLKMLITQCSLPATLLLGMLNGFLPCGLVYAACAGALSTGSLLATISYMAAFGLGTVPMMLGIGVVRSSLPVAIRLRFQKLIPACFFLMGALLILRGLPLSIPFVSPNVSGRCPRCDPGAAVPFTSQNL